MMKKINLLFGLLAVLSAGCISACGSTNSVSSDSDASNSEVQPQYCHVYFIQDNVENIVKEVEYGTDLIDIPTPNQITGYTVSWDRTDFTNIREDLIVKAVKTAKTYTINFDPNGGSIEVDTVTVTYNQEYSFEKAFDNELHFVSWKYGNIKIADSGIWTLDNEEGVFDLVAEWGDSEWTSIH